MKYSLQDLQGAFAELSFRYRKERGEFITTDLHKAAYLLYRAPATLGVLSFVLKELKQWFHGEIGSVMDIGAGHGLSVALFQESFPSLKEIFLLEKEKMVKGKEFSWIEKDVRDYSFDQPVDLSLFSYILNELSLEEALSALTKCFKGTQKILVIMEPGSQEGFQRILAYRDHLISLGGFIMAPCPHHNKCPIDWCHFSVRIQRSPIHRQIKGGELNYEDEKFCYLIVSKEPFTAPYERVVGKSDYRSKMATIPLCTTRGFEKKIFTKAKTPNFPEVRKARWGDALIKN